MTRFLAIALVAALGAAWYVALPPHAPSRPGAPQALGEQVRGAFHVHTSRSDGTGSVDEIAAAAARAGLDFVVLTDHGTATAEPDLPRYREGVLLIDAVEISTYSGHVVALGLPVAPYPLAGEARDVIDDIARLGGIAIAAHPGSSKAELQWSDWNVPVAGLEWLNGDSEWRDESRWSLLRALLTYPARPQETLASLLDRPVPVLARWDTLTRESRVVAIAGADAHARIGMRSLGEPYGNTSSLHVPSYEGMFRLFSNVLADTVLTGDAAVDAGLVLAALGNGHVYSTVDALAGGAAITFTATDGATRASAGDAMPLKGPATLRAQIQGPGDARIELLKDGVVAAVATGTQLEHVADRAAPGVYRVEVSLPGAPGQPPVPWIVSNPIYLGRGSTRAAPAETRRPASRFLTRYGDGEAAGWTVATSPESRAAVDVARAARGTELALRYALGGAASASPFAAFTLASGTAIAEYDRIVFTARADRPMRLSVQLREPSDAPDQRWRRSVVLDTIPREMTVYFDDLKPVSVATRDRPNLALVDSVLFVVDTVNTPLGGSGRIWIDDVKYGR